jgi:hypothetical protein
MQPFIDLMMQDMDLMSFGLFDENWLGVQNSDAGVGFDAPMQMPVGFEQRTAL